MAKFSGSPALQLQGITDAFVRSNFQKLVDYFAKQNQLLNFQFIDIEFEGAETERRVLHGLGLIPRDLIRLEIAGEGRVTFHRESFTKDFLFVSSTGPARVRFLVGLYWKADIGHVALGDEIWESTPLAPTTPVEYRQEFSGTGLDIADLARTPVNLKVYVAGKLQRASAYRLEGLRLILITPLGMGEYLETIYN